MNGSPNDGESSGDASQSLLSMKKGLFGNSAALLNQPVPEPEIAAPSKDSVDIDNVVSKETGDNNENGADDVSHNDDDLPKDSSSSVANESVSVTDSNDEKEIVDSKSFTAEENGDMNDTTAAADSSTLSSGDADEPMDESADVSVEQPTEKHDEQADVEDIADKDEAPMDRTVVEKSVDQTTPVDEADMESANAEDEPAKEEEIAEEEPIVTPKRGRGRPPKGASPKKVTPKPASPPKSPRGRGRPRKSETVEKEQEDTDKTEETEAEKNEENETELIDEKEEVGEKEKVTPRRGRSTRSAAATPVTNTRPTRAAKTPAVPKTTSESSQKSTPSQKTPETGKRGRGRPKLYESHPKSDDGVEEDPEEEREKEEFEEQEQEVVEKKNVTPKGSKTPKPTKSAAKTPKGKKPVVKDDDPDDPYSMDFGFDKHPEPLKSITMERKSFGNVSYTRSGASTPKYEQTEKTASEKVGNLSELAPHSSKRRSYATDTPKQANLNLTRSAPSKKRTKEESDDEDEPMETQTTPTTPKARGRKPGVKSPTATPKKAVESLTLPSLTAEEQWQVDHPEDEHAPLVPGARVYAAFQKTYYSAIIGSTRDALGRYRVKFVTDEIIRDVPAAGIIPITALVANKLCDFTLGNDVISARILRAPNAAQADEWTKGEFAVVNEENEEQHTVAWSELVLDISDWRDYMDGVSKAAQSVSSDNISNSADRRQRRSVLASATPSTPAAKIPAKGKTPAKTPAKAAATPAKATPKRSIKRGAKEEEVEEKPSFAKKAKVDEDYEAEEETDIADEEERGVNDTLFDGKTFILTSANRKDAGLVEGEPVFRKNELKSMILERGGTVVDDITSSLDEGESFLISDTYYRTHKYLAAMARNMPCVKFTWILDCVRQEKCLDYKQYLLSGGISLVDDQIYPLPTIRDKLLVGKKLMIHSAAKQAKSMSFNQIWEPMVELLGGEIVADLDEGVDVLVSDPSADEDLIAEAEKAGTAVVSSEWLIQSMIMGSLPAYDAHPRFAHTPQT